ncbi:50S ribosomal protein L29 [archaeon]|jgi:large subunit ribosomal protein L29|nr:50S ribosomal protein L29 [archaeon]MBT4416745.1 50S ribosomal protein L29 [archaeon]
MKLKKSDLAKMEKKDLEKRLTELRKELIKVNAQIATGTVPENPGDVKNIKKNIARILTKFNNKKMGDKNI